MVATTDCVEKSKPITGNKVSKPLMEKKRRARINKCLDQLKSLLESYYSSSIRKRKLEKADILELTVKHLRNLQKIQSCATSASEFSDFQSGFSSCLANFNQYLLMADNLNGSDRWMLSKLSSKLCCSRGGGGGGGGISSTMDSGPGRADRPLPPAAGPDEGKAVKSKALNPHSASKDAMQSSGTKHAAHTAESTQNTHAKSPSHKKFHSVSSHCRNEAANIQHNVWRPW
ncbi:hypothetical protein PAMP_011837 [Pampus punctatissimus]